MSRPDLFQYVDYREFLSDWLAAPKQRISQRGLARRAEASPALVSLIRKGERSLDLTRGAQFARAMSLSPEETRYWLDLIQLDHGETQDVRQAAWDRIIAAQRFRDAASAISKTTALFGQWYYSALASAVRCGGFVEDHDALAAKLGVEPAEVRAALVHLVEMGILSRGPDRRLRFADDVRTDHDVVDDALAKSVRRLHHAWLRRAAHALDHTPHEQRQFAAFTLAVPAAQRDALRARIQSFIEELAAFSTDAHNADDVFQLNLQLFPLLLRDRE